MSDERDVNEPTSSNGIPTQPTDQQALDDLTVLSDVGNQSMGEARLNAVRGLDISDSSLGTLGNIHQGSGSGPIRQEGFTVETGEVGTTELEVEGGEGMPETQLAGIQTITSDVEESESVASPVPDEAEQRNLSTPSIAAPAPEAPEGTLPEEGETVTVAPEGDGIQVAVAPAEMVVPPMVEEPLHIDQLPVFDGVEVVFDDAPETDGPYDMHGKEGEDLRFRINAYDPDGGDVTISFSGSAYGTVTYDAVTGEYVYRANDENWWGEDTITVYVRDDEGNVISRDVTIRLDNVDDEAEATITGNSGDESTTADPTVIRGTIHATDIDGDIVAYEVLDGGTHHGTLTVDENGNFVFTAPDNNWNGTETFTVRLTDALGGTTDVEVPITVRPTDDRPELTSPSEVSGNLGQEGSFSGDIDGYDPDGDPLTYGIIDPATGNLVPRLDTEYGTVVIDPATGEYTFTPNGKAKTLDDGDQAEQTFQVAVTDGNSISEPQTVNLTIDGANDAPVVDSVTLTLSTDEDNSTSGTIKGSDVDAGDVVTYTLVAPDGSYVTELTTQYGTVTIDPETGEYTFTPNADMQGLDDGDSVRDSFQVAAYDGTAYTDAQSVSVTITGTNDAPVVEVSEARGDEDDTITGQVVARDVDGDTLTYSFGTDANGQAITTQETANGTVTINPKTGEYIFTPNDNADRLNEGQSATESFTVHVSDGTVTTTQTVTVTLDGTDDATEVSGPVDLGAIAEDGSITFSEEDLLKNASDVDNTLHVENVQVEGGTLVKNDNGTWTFTPSADFNGSVVISYDVVTDSGAVTSTTAELDVTAVNDAPVVEVSEARGDEDDTITGQVVARDVDGDTLTYSFGTDDKGNAITTLETANGTVVIDPNTGEYIFTPNDNADRLNEGQSATESFTVHVSDGTVTTTQTVTVTLDGTDDATEVSGPVDLGAIAEDGSITFSEEELLKNASDVDNALHVDNVRVEGGTLVDNGDGTWTFTPSENFSGSVSISYDVVTDSGEVTSTTAELEVTGVADTPELEASVTVTAGSSAVTAGSSAVTLDVDAAVGAPTVHYENTGNATVGDGTNTLVVRVAQLTGGNKHEAASFDVAVVDAQGNTTIIGRGQASGKDWQDVAITLDSGFEGFAAGQTLKLIGHRGTNVSIDKLVVNGVEIQGESGSTSQGVNTHSGRGSDGGYVSLHNGSVSFGLPGGEGEERTPVSETRALSISVDGQEGALGGVTLGGLPAGATVSYVDADGRNVTLSVGDDGSLHLDADQALRIADVGATLTTAPGVVVGDITTSFDIVGTAGDDVLGGGDANDHIVGGDGDDVIHGDAGVDHVNVAINLSASTEDSSETITYTIDGIPAGLTLANSDGPLERNPDGTYTLDADQLDGLYVQVPVGSPDAQFDLTVTATSHDGDDTASVSETLHVDARHEASEGAGDDTLEGGAGNDTIYGGGGNDTLMGGAGADTLDAGSGNDLVIANGSEMAGDVMHGGAGFDTLKIQLSAAEYTDAVRAELLAFKEFLITNPGETFTFETLGGATADGFEKIEVEVDGEVISLNSPPTVDEVRGGVGAESTTDAATRVTGTIVASDLDNDTLSYEVLAGGGEHHGQLSVDENGNFVFVAADPDWHGTDSFTVRVSDGQGGYVDQTVNITVTPSNDGPNAADDTITVEVETARPDTTAQAPSLSVDISEAVVTGADGSGGAGAGTAPATPPTPADWNGLGNLGGTDIGTAPIPATNGDDAYIARGWREGDIRMGAGDDRLTMVDGMNSGTIDMGEGDDKLKLQANVKSVKLGDGNDQLDAVGEIQGSLDAGSGDDMVRISGNVVENGRVDLGEGNDYLSVGQHLNNNSTIDAGSGNDVVKIGGNVNGKVGLGEGDDYLSVGEHLNNNSTIDAGSGDDVVKIAKNVNGTVDLGDGDDYLSIGGHLNGSATIDAGAGDDVVRIGGDVNGKVDLGDGNDYLSSTGYLNGSTINAGAGNDVIDFGKTNQWSGGGTIDMGSGNDFLTFRGHVQSTLMGGAGQDTLVLTDYTATQWANNTDNVRNYISGFEKVVLGDGTVLNLDTGEVNVSTYTYTVTLDAGLNDTDGSETLSSATLANIPSDATVRVNGEVLTPNPDGTYTVPLDANGDAVVTVSADRPLDLSDVTTSVTATEASTGDARTTTVTGEGTAAGDTETVGGEGAPQTGPVTISAADLLANDHDVDGDTLAIIGVGNASNGTVELDADGNVVFIPEEGFVGTATFEYTVSDGQGGTATATVTVNVTGGNQAPVVSHVSGGTAPESTTSAPTVVTGTIAASDADGDTLTYSVVDNGASHNGTLSIDADGNFTFTAKDASWDGSDTFIVRVSDGQGGSVDVPVTITVTPVADTPVVSVSTGGLEQTSISLTNLGGTAGYRNTYGYYVMDDQGNPTTGKILFADVQDSVCETATIEGVDPGRIGYFIIPDGASRNSGLSDGDSVTFAKGTDGKWRVYDADGRALSGQDMNVIFSDSQFNSDGLAHMVDNAEAGDQNWEDMAHGGDRDFDDVNIVVSQTTGAASNDVIRAGGGDTVFGGAGNDVITADQGGWGGATLVGNSGNDTITGTNSADVIYGDDMGGASAAGGYAFMALNVSGSTSDADETLTYVISSLPAGVTLVDADGNPLPANADGSYSLTADQLAGLELKIPADGSVTDLELSVTAISHEGGTTASATTSTQVDLSGLIADGADTLYGGGGRDTLYGGGGNDMLYGGDGNDTLVGGAGDDLLNGGAGADKLVGGDGTDTVDYSDSASGVNVYLGAGDGNAYGGPGGYGIGGDAQGDTYSGIENVIGSAHDDYVYGAAGGTTAHLGAGNDTFDNSEAPHVVASDTVDGGAGNDTIWTGNGDDLLIGGSGNDVLYGEAGNDTLVGGSGNDVMYGGDGSDTFLFDFGDGHDTVVGGTGANWTDTLDLTSLGAGVRLEFTVNGGESWTATTDGTEHQADLGQDKDGSVVIHHADGSTEQVDFHSLEQIKW